MQTARLGFLGLVALASCASLADTGGGDQALPNAAAGPFREIRREELGNDRPAPYALRDDEEFPRDLSVIDVDAVPATLEIFGYAARTVFPEGTEPDPAEPPNEIVRYHAFDGRSFERQLDTVLRPELGWEGGRVGAPSALRAAGQIWLYYEAEAGIGLARSDDGLGFERESVPVLAAAGVGWEQSGTPQSPSVIQLPDGSWRMFYEVALGDGESSAIGEAASPDGVIWARLGTAPALGPSGPSGDPAIPSYDGMSTAAPHAVLGQSAEGRSILWLYYAALGDTGVRTIAVAARHGFDGPFVRAVAPVFGSSGSLEPTEPWVVRWPGFTLLFATEKAGSSESLDYPAVAVGVAPATVTLPPPVSD